MFCLSQVNNNYWNRDRIRLITMLLLLCYLLFNLCGLFSLICQAQSVPNLYVFGDSIFDSGCKSAHAAGLKTGYLPYGIKCAWLSACRFTNGKTIPEIIGQRRPN